MATAPGVTANSTGAYTAECNNCKEIGIARDSVSFCCECDLNLCTSCDKMHGKFAPTHKVDHVEEGPKPDEKQLFSMVSCSVHSEEKVEFYCTKHSSVICQFCKPTHSSCIIQCISEVCERISFSQDKNDTVAQLLELQEKTDKLTREKQLILERYRTELEERKNNFKTLKRRFINIFENYESQLESQEKSFVNAISISISACSSISDQLRQQTTLPQQERNNSDKLAIFWELVDAKNILKKCENMFKEIRGKRISSVISVKEDKSLPELLDKLSTLVHWEVTDSEEIVKNYTDEELPKKKSFFNIKACTVEKEINGEVQNDNEAPYISGCCWMNDGQAILCDNFNSKIKILDEEMNIKYTAPCSTYPYDVACINESSAVITLPKAKALQFISIKPGFKFNQTKELKLSCFGIGVHDKNVYVCINNSDPLTKGVKILTIKGDDVSFIPHLGPDAPRYLRLNADGTRICYDGGSSKDVFINCVTTDGYGIFSISSSALKSSRSIIHDEHDNLMVCDAENKCVMIISSEGKCGNKLLTEKDNIYQPKSMCLNKSYDRLLVASWLYQSSRSNLSKITVFKLEYQ